MKNFVSKLRVAIKGLMKEEGQDLVEYALLVALIAFAPSSPTSAPASPLPKIFLTRIDLSSNTVAGSMRERYEAQVTCESFSPTRFQSGTSIGLTSNLTVYGI